MLDEIDDPAMDSMARPAEEEAAPEEDFRTLGYGHRAYQPDPRAQYSFKPWVVRPLPANPRKRWR